jgi:D-alanine-D-alanine ligase
LTLDELKEKRIGVLMGGLSSERAISFKSGEAIIASLRRSGMTACSIDVGHDIAFVLRSGNIDVAFIALHGRYGEDGLIQGLLEMMRIPYTGSGLLASALGMNKALSRQVFVSYGLPTPPYMQLTRSDARSFKEENLSPLRCPVVVKPVSGGSSIGVTIVDDPSQMTQALDEALRFDETILVEQYISGMEVNVGILGHVALGAIEIRSEKRFYDYQAKYEPGMSKHIFPAPLSAGLYQEVMDWGLKAHRALGCSGYSRVDLLIDQKMKPYILEVNTLPGMTETSLLPEMARGIDISFDQLVLRILETASMLK